MNIKALNLVLLACLGVVAALNWLVKWETASPNFEFLPEMARSVPYNSFLANANFADGKTLQPPPPGAIPRGFQPLDYQRTPAEAVRAGAELRNPYAANAKEAIERGAAVYSAFCAHCHGPAGRGDGAVVRRGYPGPPSLLAEQTSSKPDGQLFHIISYGQANMPGHAAQISREDRWKVICYIRTLQEKSRASEQAQAIPSGN